MILKQMNEVPRAGSWAALGNINVQLNDKKKETFREAKNQKNAHQMGV